MDQDPYTGEPWLAGAKRIYVGTEREDRGTAGQLPGARVRDGTVTPHRCLSKYSGRLTWEPVETRDITHGPNNGQALGPHMHARASTRRWRTETLDSGGDGAYEDTPAAIRNESTLAP